MKIISGIFSLGHYQRASRPHSGTAMRRAGVSPALREDFRWIKRSQLDTAPSTSFPLGFLKFIAHPTSLRSVAHRGLPFSDHYTSWVCTEMLIYHHVSSAGLCEPAWVRCTPLGKPGISSQREEMLHPPAGLCESAWSSFSSRSLRSKSRVCDCAGQRVG